MGGRPISVPLFPPRNLSYTFLPSTLPYLNPIPSILVLGRVLSLHFLLPVNPSFFPFLFFLFFSWGKNNSGTVVYTSTIVNLSTRVSCCFRSISRISNSSHIFGICLYHTIPYQNHSNTPIHRTGRHPSPPKASCPHCATSPTQRDRNLHLVW
ncbi:hypothetical protein F4781DRAFT_170096 [Annulohypoxylon bovei var. microspora]|nr:hypothetical protein F4781DRAFT_170096 [Annulohypoxylon bovei var. microspora]